MVIKINKALMCLPVNERYEAIREFQNNFHLTTTEASQRLGIAYQTVVNANNNLNPRERTYDTKIKEIHKIFIHSKTLTNPHISGDELARMIYEFFGLKVSGRTVNRYRNEMQLKFRSPLPSVFLSENAIVKRKNWTQFHIDNRSHWRDVAFSDESWFLLGRNKKWVWVDKNNLNDKMYSHRQAHPPPPKSWSGGPLGGILRVS